MANKKHLKILKQGVEVWNKWREENPEIKPDLSGNDLYGKKFRSVNLSNTDLRHAELGFTDLSHANLTDSNLSSASLISADLSYSNLGQATLRGSALSHTNFNKAILRNVDLSNSDLINANLIGTDLTAADLGMAYIGDTTFGNNDLSTVKGLDLVIFFGPCTIGVDTIHNSGGNIPEAFLRGCGLSDWEIEATKLYQRDLTPGRASEILYKIHELRTNPAIQFNSCFISYSSKNHPFADDLYKRLQDIGVRCWFAPEDIKIGDKFRQRIDEAIRIHDKLLVILSEESISSSWVEEEVESALERERREKRLVLFPIRIDDAVINSDQAWAASLRRMRHIGDFSKWKDHDSYSKAFERLLRDLKAEA